MHTLMILCLAVVGAFAAPAPEYNYERPAAVLAPIATDILPAQSGNVELASKIDIIGASEINEQRPIENGGIVGSSSDNYGIGSIATSATGQATTINALPAPVVKTAYNKVFYIHSAPEEEEEEESLNGDDSENSTKNIRVIVIQTPENKGLHAAAVKLAKSVSEDKTAIYVLNKQADLSQLRNELVQIKAINQKPEVHFIKYKTPEEAAYAQQSIQAAYNEFSGPTKVVNAGSIPVQNFIGTVQQSQRSAVPVAVAQPSNVAPVNAQNVAGAISAVVAQQQTYLPPAQTYLPSNA